MGDNNSFYHTLWAGSWEGGASRNNWHLALDLPACPQSTPTSGPYCQGWVKHEGGSRTAMSSWLTPTNNEAQRGDTSCSKPIQPAQSHTAAYRELKLELGEQCLAKICIPGLCAGARREHRVLRPLFPSFSFLSGVCIGETDTLQHGNDLGGIGPS